MKVSGLDVHKDSIFCGIYNGKQQSSVTEHCTFTEDIRSMGIMLKNEGVRRIAMESTSVYWIPVWNILEEMGFELLLVNPYLIKQMPGRKSDVQDAQWIATLLHKGLLKGSLVPGKQIRELRTYSRRYVKLSQMINSIFQEMEHVLEMCNIHITSLVSRNNSVSVRNVIQEIINGNDSAEELACFIHGRILKSKGEKVKKSLDGFIPEHQRFTLSLLWQQYNLYQEQLEEVESKMLQVCQEHYSLEMKLLQSVPGIKEQSAMQIIAETGADMRAFSSSNKITGWAGLRPRNDESAGKYKSTSVTNGNKYLRRILVQCAWAASRTKGSYYKSKFEQLCVRKSRKKALIAIARKLLCVIWSVLNEKQLYNPKLQPVYNTENIKAKMRYHTREIEKLQQLGIVNT